MGKSLCLCCLLFLFSGFEQGVQAQWKQVSVFADPVGTQRSSITLTHLKSGLYAVRDSVLLRSTDNGESWQKLSVFPHMCDIFSIEEWTIAANDSPLYVTGGCPMGARGVPSHSHLACSTDGGLSWQNTSTFGYDVYPRVTVFETGKLIKAHSGYRHSIIDFSTNGGVNWDSTASIGLPDWAGVSNLISMKSFLILSAAGYGESNEFLYKSTDNGESWERLETGFLVNGYFSVLSVGNSIFAEAYFATGDSALAIESTDEGQTWTVAPKPSKGLDEIWTDGKFLFTRGEGSAVEVAGIGEPWRTWGDGLPMPGDPLQQLVFSDDFAFALLYVPEHSRQEVWRRPLAELITGVDPHDRSANAREFQLLQNYPNPFNPSTTIRYALPHRSHVTLTVYNTLGQQVDQLVNANIDAGHHEIQFNATNLASGVYFYRLQAGGFVETKRLLLMR